jgi:probable F420-dependent oxidoreductase
MTTSTAKRAEFGVRLPVAGPLASREAIVATARRTEELGFDAVWVHDFIAWTRFQDQHHVSCGSVEVVEAAGEDAPPIFYESLSNLAFLAGITERVRLGVAVLCLPYRNPVVAAKQIATIDQLSGGRLILGIGVGAAATTHNQDFEVLGVSRKTKYSQTRDHLAAMVAIWTQDQPSYEGRFVTFPQTEIDPKPAQRPYPPIWVGGGGPKSVDIAAEWATGWLPPWISPEGYPARIAELTSAAAQHGRPDVDFTIATEVYASLAATDEEAQKSAARTLGVLPEGFADDATPDAIAQAGLVGSPETVAAKLRKYVDAGVGHYELKFVYHSIEHLMQQLEMFAKEVIPAVRGE